MECLHAQSVCKFPEKITKLTWCTVRNAVINGSCLLAFDALFSIWALMHSSEERKTEHVLKNITTSVNVWAAPFFFLPQTQMSTVRNTTICNNPWTFAAEASRFLSYVGVHTHTASLAFIRTHTTAAWQLYYLMIRLALFDKVLCLTFKTRVLGKLGSKLFKRTWAKRNCTTRYTLTRTVTLKQSLPTESDTRDFRGQCSGEQCYMG